MNRKKSASDKASGSAGRPKKKARSQSGLVSLTRDIIKRSTDYGAVSISYHVSVLFQSFTSTLPHLHFVGGNRYSRHNLPPEHAKALGQCNEFLIKLARPIILSDYLSTFAKLEPNLTKTIMDTAREHGVEDQFMVPVFGPYNVSGVISFGFPRVLDRSTDTFLDDLEAMATLHHVHSVREFGARSEPVHLSAREHEVLNWMGKGKSNSDIAEILGISTSSVDTYTRRIFEKMGVHDRVSATVLGLRYRMISFD